jgi:phage shock protein A
MSGLSDTSAFEAFNRMAEKIEESERRSLAAAEVDQALGGDSLEQDFLRLEAGQPGGGDVEDRLLALKSEMGLIAGGTPEEPKQLGAGEEDEAPEAAESAAPAAAAEPAEPPTLDAETEDGEGSGDEVIHEAQLIEEFERLEKDLG